MVSSVNSTPFLSYDSDQQGFALWGQVSQITTNLNRAFSQIGQDSGNKSISLGLDADEQNLLFSLDNGSVGQDLLNATLITSASRTIGPSDPGDFQTNYSLGQLSTTTGVLTAYQGPNLVRSSRLDTLV